jgi:hypothetical protein
VQAIHMVPSHRCDQIDSCARERVWLTACGVGLYSPPPFAHAATLLIGLLARKQT